MNFINPKWLCSAQVISAEGDHLGFISEVRTDGSASLMRRGKITELSRAEVETRVAMNQVVKSSAKHKQFVKTNPYK